MYRQRGFQPSAVVRCPLCSMRVFAQSKRHFVLSLMPTSGEAGVRGGAGGNRILHGKTRRSNTRSLGAFNRRNVPLSAAAAACRTPKACARHRTVLANKRESRLDSTPGPTVDPLRLLPATGLMEFRCMYTVYYPTERVDWRKKPWAGLPTLEPPPTLSFLQRCPAWKQDAPGSGCTCARSPKVSSLNREEAVLVVRGEWSSTRFCCISYACKVEVGGWSGESQPLHAGRRASGFWSVSGIHCLLKLSHLMQTCCLIGRTQFLVPQLSRLAKASAIGRFCGPY
jgi:hypothetical protein